MGKDLRLQGARSSRPGRADVLGRLYRVGRVVVNERRTGA